MNIELDKECEITYRFGNRYSKIKGTIIAHDLAKNFVRFKVKNDGREFIISLSHIVEIN